MSSGDILDVNEYVFGLDIGTRSIVGIVGYKDNDKFNIIASHTVLHDTRAMIDGQIHDIEKVANTVNLVKQHLENQISFQLKNVCIAAAGRVLKTKEVHVEEELDNTELITNNHIHLLELMAIEEAHKILNKEISVDNNIYHCVGSSVIRYYLNDYTLSNLEGHKGKKIGVDLLATFLPQEVVDSLYSVINRCNLKVSNLTLEPIAAIDVAIPEQFRLLNIALVDVGAGTSDIAITKEGSIIAYGMIPMAGDEITEQIVHNYLVDFSTAERIKLDLNELNIVTFKDIMGISHSVSSEEIYEKIKPTMEALATKISDKIIELNGGKSTNAVFCVGGGGRLNDFTNLLAEKLVLPSERVALRGSEVLNDVIYENEEFTNPEMVTPVGICINGLNKNKTDFINVNLNGEEIKIFNNNNLTLIDIVAHKGFNHKNLICRRGKDLNYILNGESKKIRGCTGEPATILVNDEPVSLNYPISAGDEIVLKVAKHGSSPTLQVSDLVKELEPINIYINNDKFAIPYKILVNNNIKDMSYIIQNKDVIEIDTKYTITNILELINISIIDDYVYVNNEKKYLHYLVKKNDEITINLQQHNNKIITNKIEESFDCNSNCEIQSSNNKSTTFTVNVNGKEVILKGKKSYVFVDIFDYIDFDLKNPKGSISCLINGRTASYMEEINLGDNIDVFWNK
jgi:cell division protein FtsA